MRRVSYLYVEDNADLRDTVCALIARPHRECVAVPSAEEALALMEDRRFDALMTDVSLPGLSGIDLARRWLETDRKRWVIMCSGFDFRRELDGLGPHVRVLVKGFELETLEALLEEIDAAILGSLS